MTILIHSSHSTNHKQYVYWHEEGEDDIGKINSLISVIGSEKGGSIMLPSRDYAGTGSINLKSGVTLNGCGGGREGEGYGTQIVTDSPTAVFMDSRHASVRDLNLRSTTDSANVIHIRGGRENLIRDVWVTDAGDGGTGVFIEGGRGYGSYVNRLVRVHAIGLETGVRVYGTILSGVRRANHNSLRECRTDSCDVGVAVEEADSVHLTSHHAENNRVAGIKILGRSIRTGISHSYFENRNGVDIDASGTSTGGNGWVKFAFTRHGSILDPLNKVQII